MLPLAGSAFLFTNDNITLWIPFLITPAALPTDLQPYYPIWLFVEMAGHIFTAFTILLNIYLALRVNAFNLNMQILNVYGIFVMGATHMSTRMILILIELGYYSLNDVADFLVPLTLAKVTAWMGIYNCVIYITIERYAALKYSSDYETNNRVSISVAIIVANTVIAFTVAYLLVYNIMNGAVYMLIIFFMSNISCVAFSRIALRNIKEDKEVASFRGKYSVSRRWQVKDNISMTKDIRILVYGCAAQISFYLPIFFLPPLFLEHDPQWISALQVNKAVYQMACSYGFGIAYLFCTLCVTRHLDYVKSIFWTSEVQKISPARNELQTTDDYFESLKNWWEVETECDVSVTRVVKTG